MQTAYSPKVRLRCLVLRILLNMSFLVTNVQQTLRTMSRDTISTAPSELNN